MKSMKMNLDFKNDTIFIDGKNVPLSCTSTGHYVISLTHFDADAGNKIVLHAKNLCQLDKREKKLKAIKLHKQLCHASKEKLVNLVKNSTFKDKEFIECIKEVCDECQTRAKFKKQHPKPAVSFPLASEFNSLVCMDLKEYKYKK